MKIRNGFVSNSSSSSFICDICETVAVGWDMSLDDAEMFECVNGHVMCEDHLDLSSIGDIDRWSLPEELCPVCTGKVVTKDSLLTYLIQRSGKSREELEQEFREKCF